MTQAGRAAGRKPRILVCLPLPPWKTGGIEEYGYSVARECARDFEVRVFTTAVDVPAKLPDEPFELVLQPGRILLERPLTIDPRLLARQIRWADAVHIHTPFPGAELWAAFFARAWGKRLLVTYHMDAVSASAESGRALGKALQNAYDTLSLKPALSLVPKIATNSVLYINWSRVLPKFRRKVVAVHQGIRDDRLAPVDPKAARAWLAKKAGAPEGAVLFAFVGRLVTYKGMHVTVPAFAQVVKAGVDAHLIIGGRGPEKENLERMAREAGVADRVHFLGFVDDADLTRLYAGCDVFVCPSVSPLESTPITLLEAMAQGTAVIGGEVGGTAETVPPGGFNRIVKPEDVAGLAAAMRELSAEARNGAKQPRYSRTWREVANDYEAILMPGKKSAPAP